MIVKKYLVVLLTLALCGCGESSSGAKQQVDIQDPECVVNPYLDPSYADFCQKNVLAAKLYQIGGSRSHLYEAYFPDGDLQLVYMSHGMIPHRTELRFTTTVGRAPLSLIVDKDSWEPVEGSRRLYRDKNNVYCFRQRNTGAGNLLVLEEIDADKVVSVEDYKSSDPDIDRELQERKTEFPDLIETDGTYLIDMFCGVVTFEDFLTRSEKYERR